MKFQFLPENFSRSENAPPFETRKIRHFEVERIFLENKKMVQHCDFTFSRKIPLKFSDLKIPVMSDECREVTDSGGKIILNLQSVVSTIW